SPGSADAVGGDVRFLKAPHGNLVADVHRLCGEMSRHRRGLDHGDRSHGLVPLHEPCLQRCTIRSGWPSGSRARMAAVNGVSTGGDTGAALMCGSDSRSSTVVRELPVTLRVTKSHQVHAPRLL